MHATADPALTTLGARVRARRLELGLSQQELADRTGLHHTLIGHAEHGRRNLRLDSLCKRARGLDVDLGEMLLGLQQTLSGDDGRPQRADATIRICMVPRTSSATGRPL